MPRHQEEGPDHITICCSGNNSGLVREVCGGGHGGANSATEEGGELPFNLLEEHHG